MGKKSPGIYPKELRIGYFIIIIIITMSSLSCSSKVLILRVIPFQCIEMRDGTSSYRSALGEQGPFFLSYLNTRAIYCVTIQRKKSVSRSDRRQGEGGTGETGAPGKL